MKHVNQNWNIDTITGEVVMLGENTVMFGGDGPGRVREDEPTIGLITALPIEFAATHPMLDQARRVSIADDAADYVLGTMPSRDPAEAHSVVLTLAQTGNTAAAAACTSLIRSFRSVNVVVMVGIAAGVPLPDEPRKHVRLGDIVAGTWGVVDYDHVDVTLRGVRLRGGFPQPSPLLKRAADMLEVEEALGRRPWEEWLRLSARTGAAVFARPDPSTDILYAADESGLVIQHPDPALSGHRPGLPRVHHGLIGSADRSLRDARVRHALATVHELRALEMEGTGIGRAGFLNGLEWFVVRGVSDYGDSRTTEIWRPYAALAAASYVRAMLGRCAALQPRGGHAKGRVV